MVNVNVSQIGMAQIVCVVSRSLGQYLYSTKPLYLRLCQTHGRAHHGTPQQRVVLSDGD